MHFFCMTVKYTVYRGTVVTCIPTLPAYLLHGGVRGNEKNMGRYGMGAVHGTASIPPLAHPPP